MQTRNTPSQADFDAVKARVTGMEQQLQQLSQQVQQLAQVNAAAPPQPPAAAGPIAAAMRAAAEQRHLDAARAAGHAHKTAVTKHEIGALWPNVAPTLAALLEAVEPLTTAAERRTFLAAAMQRRADAIAVRNIADADLNSDKWVPALMSLLQWRGPTASNVPTPRNEQTPRQYAYRSDARLFAVTTSLSGNDWLQCLQQFSQPGGSFFTSLQALIEANVLTAPAALDELAAIDRKSVV